MLEPLAGATPSYFQTCWDGVATTTGRENNITEERMLAILPVCCFFFVVISLVSHMLAMATTTGLKDITEEI